MPAVSVALSRFLKRTASSSLPVALKLWTGDRIGPANAQIIVSLRDPAALSCFIGASPGKLARAYVDERIDIEGDLRDVIALGTSLGAVAPTRRRVWLPGPWHTRSSDRRAVQRHYDLSNDFFALWLDRNRVYSCAYFRGDDDSLDEAQEQKFEHICRKLDLRVGETLLDVGCGWGGLMFWAARNYGAHCLGITLSREQHDYVARRIGELGLGSVCQVRLADYRDLDPTVCFDKIVSVGMFEHVGRRRLPIYFSTVHRLLKPGGLLLNHGISSAWMKGQTLGSDVSDFYDRYVFPDGELVHIAEALQAMGACGFEARDVECLRPHYAKTLWHWVDRLDRNAATARRLVGEKAYRIWRVYMAGSAFAFERGWISIYQTLAGKLQDDGALAYPLTREHLYAGLPPRRPMLAAVESLSLP
jgi:cyclopropane-fatty-acyl-phospholipid synthase